MKGKIVREYPKMDKNGQEIWMTTFKVIGTPEELAQFKEAQGEYYREDAVHGAIFTTPGAYDKVVELAISSKGRVYVEQTDLKRMAARVKALGGNLGQEMAKIGARQIMGMGQSLEDDEVPADKKADLNK